MNSESEPEYKKRECKVCGLILPQNRMHKVDEKEIYTTGGETYTVRQPLESLKNAQSAGMFSKETAYVRRPVQWHSKTNTYWLCDEHWKERQAKIEKRKQNEKTVFKAVAIIGAVLFLLYIISS